MQATQKVAAQVSDSLNVSALDTKSVETEQQLESSSNLFPISYMKQGSAGDSEDDPAISSFAMHDFNRISVLPSASLKIQTKLKINEAGDKYEVEADRVAAQVMRMEKTDVGNISPANNFLQRKCSSCEGEIIQRKPLLTNFKMSIQRKCASCQEEEIIQRKALSQTRGNCLQREAMMEEDKEEREGFLQRKLGNGRSHAKPSKLIDRSNLHSGGQALSPSIRSFFEPKFGADFSQVRIHNETSAAQMSDEINAKAFTYGSHIYFNSGEYNPETNSGKTLLAHELTHVLQQTKSSTTEVIPQGRSIQRAYFDKKKLINAPYWEPKDKNGNKNHSLLLPLIGKELGMFTEAPVPNAKATNVGHGLKGSADMYGGSTTVGVTFENHSAPVSLPVQRGKKILKNGVKFDHEKDSAPKVDTLQNLSEIPNAPKKIVVGDLKPSQGTVEAAEGTAQLDNYIEGFKLAAVEVNEMSPSIPWNLTQPTKLNKAVPASLAEPNSPVSSQDLFLKVRSKVVSNKITTKGKIYVNKDTSNAGIWNYTWKPDTEFTDPLPPQVTLLGDEVIERIRKPVFVSPLDKQVTSKLKNPKQRSPKQIQRAVRTKDKKLPNKDWFKFSKWRDGVYKKYNAKYKKDKKHPDFEKAEIQELILQEQKARKNSGFKTTINPDREKNFKKYNQLKFWVSKKALIFGRFRGTFGRLFIKIGKAYNRVREKFKNRLNQVKNSGGSGIAGSAMKAAFRIIKIAGKVIINETINRLKTSFTKGLGENLKSFLPVGDFEALQKKADELNTKISEIKSKARKSVDDIVKKIIQPYQKLIDKIKAAANTLGKIKRIINLVKWGARAIACATSPPVIGCLVTPAIEYLAGKVVQSCWFMKKMAPYIKKIPLIGNLSIELAKMVKGKIQEFLPESVRSVFAKIDGKIEFEVSDIKCGTGGGGPLTPTQQALLNLQERLGEEKFNALQELMKKRGLDDKIPMSIAEIEKMGDLLDESDVTAAEISRAANQTGAKQPGAKTKIVKLETILEDAKKKATGSGSTAKTNPQTPKPSSAGATGSNPPIADRLVQELKDGKHNARFKALIANKTLRTDSYYIDHLNKLKQGEVVSGRLVHALGPKNEKRIGLVSFKVDSLEKHPGEDKMTISFTRDFVLYDAAGNSYTREKANATTSLTLFFKVGK